MGQNEDGPAWKEIWPVENFNITVLLHYARRLFVYSFNSRSEFTVRTQEAFRSMVSTVLGFTMPFRNEG
jgi:hypothetical protein